MLQASLHVWPAAAALRMAGTLSLAVGDASCLCMQTLVEPCRVAIDMQRCERTAGTADAHAQPAEGVLLVRLRDQKMLGTAVLASRLSA